MELLPRPPKTQPREPLEVRRKKLGRKMTLVILSSVLVLILLLYGISAIVAAIAKPTSEEQVLTATENALTQVAEVFCLNPDESGNGEGVLSRGSGVIESADGYILTSRTVLEEGAPVYVLLSDGTSHPAVLAGSDPLSGLALLKIEAEHLPAVEFGDSDQIAPGQKLLSLGYRSVSQGIASSLGENPELGLSTYSRGIHLDRPLPAAHTGGGLFNLSGELVGLLLPEPDGGDGLFALPSNQVRQLADSIKESGRVERADLGLSGETVAPEWASLHNKPHGVLITRLDADSPLRAQGARAGDVITHINGEALTDWSQLTNWTTQFRPGTSAAFTLFRSEEETLELTVDFSE